VESGMSQRNAEERGSEIVGPRLTVYHLLPHFLDPTATEELICRIHGLTVEQVAAARAFVLNNIETVLARHLAIESRLAEGNSPEVVERAKATRAQFLKFKQWLDNRKEEDRRLAVESNRESHAMSPGGVPSFREWLAGNDSWPKKGS